MVTGQLTDKPTRGQSSHGLDNLRTGQLAEMFVGMSRSSWKFTFVECEFWCTNLYKCEW